MTTITNQRDELQSLRGDQLERQAQRELEREHRLQREAKAVAGPVARTDGGNDDSSESETDHAELREGETRDDDSHASTIVDAQLDEADKVADQPVLDVGDQAIPVGREATVAVVRVTGKTAGEYVIKKIDETVAEYNGCDPSEDVYEVVFPKRTTKDIDDLQRYPYPRSMLEEEHRVHDRDDGDNTSDEGGDE